MVDTSRHLQKPDRPLVVGYDGKSSDNFFVTNRPDLFPRAQDITTFHRVSPNDFMNSSMVRHLDYQGIDTIFSSRLERLTKDVREKAQAFLFHPHEDEKIGTAEFVTQVRGRLVILLYTFFPPLKDHKTVEGFDHLYEIDSGLLGIEKGPHTFRELIGFLVRELVSKKAKVEL